MMDSMLAVLPYWKFGPWSPWPLSVVGLKIHSFGLCIAIGISLCFYVAGRRAERKFGISYEKMQNFSVFVVLVGWPL